MKFNPEDYTVTGPRCRNCHKGSSGCGACHNTDPLDPVEGINTDTVGLAEDNSRTAITWLFASMFQMAGGSDTNTALFQPFSGADSDTVVGGYAPVTAYETTHTSDGELNNIASTLTTVTPNNVVISSQFKSSRTAPWTSGWRASEAAVAMGSTDGGLCSDDGFSFPHRTLGWKMLKDDLFGLDFDGSPIAAGQTRTFVNGSNTEINIAMAGFEATAHDIDSVCLDCHNPTVWQASAPADYVDGDALNDNYDDELLLRGLP